MQKIQVGRVTKKRDGLLITGTLANALIARAQKHGRNITDTTEDLIVSALFETQPDAEQDITVSITLPKSSNAGRIVNALRSLSTASDTQIVQAWLADSAHSTIEEGELIWALAIKADEHKHQQEASARKRRGRK